MKCRLAIGFLMGFLGISPLRAELIALDIHSRTPVAGGKSFGDAGPYVYLEGVARFAIDPKHKRNLPIVDLDLASTNKNGKVEFSSDVVILTPADPAKGNGAILYDVNNRGNKLAIRFFNDGALTPIDDPKSFGNGFLMRRGYTVVWCGWIGELLAGDGRLHLEAPVAKENGKAVRGPVRFEMSCDEPTKAMPLSRRPGHGSYRPVEEKLRLATLTWRPTVDAARVTIPREQWRLTIKEQTKPKQGVPGTLPLVMLEIQGGFRPGYLYELVCDCEGAIVQGTGFAAVRDLISFLRHDDTKHNPLLAKTGKSAITRTHAFGVSQSGRFLRHLLYQGFNEDEQGRIVFDGLMPHVAGGGLGFFNHRFAQPTRHNGQHEDHTYPADVFPFAYSLEKDHLTGKIDSILAAYAGSKIQPKIMHTQSAAEYWHRSGSLVHTSTDGHQDLAIPKNVRIYAFGGTQHGPGGAAKQTIGDNPNNPGDYRPFLRALLDGLDAWVKDGATPPASAYPRIADKTLMDWTQHATGFPKLPGVRFPEVIQRPALGFFGPKYPKTSIIAMEPPEVKGHYPVLVPASDKDGNDLSTLLLPEIQVPLATYTGWNLRRREVGAEGQLASLLGSYLPFPKTQEERQKTGDPRKSIEERYPDFNAYLEQFEKACQRLVQQRYFLEEDAARWIESRKAVREFFSK